MKTQPPKMISRRRCLEIVAASAASAISLCAASSALAATNSMKKLSWQGVLLGADASITLYSEKEAEARKAIENMLQEVTRLEAYFSLYKQHSLISRLNKNGAIENPPSEFVELIGKAIEIAETTNGRFDPTIQMLWTLLAENQRLGTTPTAAEMAAARTSIGFQKVQIDSSAIVLSNGQQLTLNGIAQGYIADRIADLLKRHGIDDVLIDTGEIKALGAAPGQDAWPISTTGMETASAPKAIALATSAPLGTVIDQGGKLGHILDPRSGDHIDTPIQQISISAPQAVLADALSTGLCMAETVEEIASVLRHVKDARLESFQT